MDSLALKLFFSFAVIFVMPLIKNSFQDCTFTSPYDILPSDEVLPETYDIAFTVKNDSLILGEANIILLVYYKTRSIILHSHKLVITFSSIKLTIKDTYSSSSGEIPFKRYVYCHKAQTLELIFKDIYPGTYNLHISFILPIDVKSLTSNDRYLWFSTIRPELNSARSIFPCWDNPETRARFNISVKHPEYCKVLSNMPISRTVNEEDSMTKTYFETTLRIAPREVGIAVIQHLIRESDLTSVETILWHRPRIHEYLQHMFAAIAACQKAFRQYIIGYQRAPKTDHVIIPNLPVHIKGYPGLVIYREEDFTYEVGSDYPGRNSSVLNLLGHEIASQWFGGVTSLNLWSEFWFTETFALFLNHIIKEKLQDKSIYDLYAVQMMQSALHQDVALNMKPVLHETDIDDKLEDLYFPMYCNKGAMLIRMLYYLFTAGDFQDVIRTYFTEVENIIFKPDNLWKYLQKHTDAKKQKWPYKVKELMDTWLTLERYPEVYVDRNFKDNTANFSADCISDHGMIPITYATKSNLTSGYAWNVAWLECRKNVTISGIPEHDFIIVNLEQSGYYRVNYNKNNWDRISNYLSGENNVHVPVVNRAQLIDDAFHFMMQGNLERNTFFNLIFYLSRETNYVVWYPMFNIMTRMSTYLQLPESKNTKTFISSLLGNLLEEIGYEERSNENDMMRSFRLLAVKWACKLNVDKCKITAQNKLIAYLEQPDTPVAPWWREWLHCTGMERAYWFTWEKWMKKCIKEQNKMCLTYLTCARDSYILLNYLKMLLGTIKMNELMKEAGIPMLFSNLFRKQANNDLLLEHFIHNLDEINKKIYKEHDINPIKLLGEAIGTIYSKNTLNMITTFARGLTFMNETLQRQIHNLIEFRHKELNKAATQFYFLTK